jgi:hypothetical protein
MTSFVNFPQDLVGFRILSCFKVILKILLKALAKLFTRFRAFTTRICMDDSFYIRDMILILYAGAGYIEGMKHVLGSVMKF